MFIGVGYSMSFSPFEMSVKDIFSGNRTYKIPNF